MWMQKFQVIIIFLIIKCNCDEWSEYQLPNNSKPLRYELWLKVNIEHGFTDFSGRVKIHVKVLENSRFITLHSRNLFIGEIKLFDRNKTLIHSSLSFDYIEDKDFLRIFLPEETVRGSEFLLDISYEGQLTIFDVLNYRGFSMGEYEERNVTMHYIYTHFEPDYARECLPCYDEPGIRSIFSVKIEHDSSYEALSNMPIMRRDKVIGGDNHVITTFYDTPHMQTYLLAFFIHKFYSIRTDSLTKPQRIFTRLELSENKQIKFAVENLDRILIEFENYFGVSYSLPKLDHIIAPHIKSAIENWGLIGYAEHYFRETSDMASMRVFFHEMAHNYFGNLLSPKSFNFIWLNEGFARFYETEMAKIVFPEQILDIEELIYESLSTAFSYDRYVNEPPLNYHVKNPEEIGNKFNTLTYNKGAAIVRMFMEGIGKDTWMKGLRNYIKNNQYSSVDPDDLYKELQRAIDEDLGGNNFVISNLMSSWVDQESYPVVTVEKTSGNKLIFTQQPIMDKSDLYPYAIPITFTTSNDLNFEDKSTKFWMTNKSIEVENFTSEWLIVNIQQIGYYTVKYDENLTNAIIEQFVKDHTKIHRTNRVWFLDGISRDCQRQEISGQQLMKLLSCFKYETNQVAIFTYFKIIQSLLWQLKELNDNYGMLQTFLRDPIAKFYKNPKLKKFRLIRNIACEIEDENCISDRVSELIQEMAKNRTIFTNLCLEFKFTNQTIFDHFLKTFNEMPSNDIKTNLLINLRCTADGESYYKLLNSILNENYTIQEQKGYASIVLGRLDSTNKIEAFFNFLEHNLNNIDERSLNSIKELIEIALNEFESQEDCNKLFIIQRKLYEIHGISTNTCKPKIVIPTRYDKELTEYFHNNKNLR